jgi:NADH-quinone oxidoreductase subunit K
MELEFLFILFILGVWGILLNRKHLLLMLISLELLLLSLNLQLIYFSLLLDDVMGQVFALFILTVAAAESAIGLALLVAFYRLRGTISMRFTNLMRG